MKQKGWLSKTFQKIFFSEDVFVIEIPSLLPGLCTSQERKMELVVGPVSESRIQRVMKVEHVLQFSVSNKKKRHGKQHIPFKDSILLHLSHVPPKGGLIFFL